MGSKTKPTQQGTLLCHCGKPGVVFKFEGTYERGQAIYTGICYRHVPWKGGTRMRTEATRRLDLIETLRKIVKQLEGIEYEDLSTAEKNIMELAKAAISREQRL